MCFIPYLMTNIMLVTPMMCMLDLNDITRGMRITPPNLLLGNCFGLLKKKIDQRLLF